LTDLAIRLGESPWKVFRAPWRAAVELVRFNLIPPHIRNNLLSVCDVGANAGDWTAAVLELANPRQIVAFEPIPDVFRKLEARFSARSNVRCVHAAVGAAPGDALFNVEEQTELSSFRRLTTGGRAMHGLESQSPKQIGVPMVTLDDELRDLDEISLLKLDVQGYEDQVVEGARRCLDRCQCLVTEVLYERNYYAGALPFLELAQLIEAVSPLRLSCVSEPALSAGGIGVWADAIFTKRPTE
jgi:FkbM family methyltransferase